MVMESRQVVALAVKQDGTYEIVSIAHPLPVDTSPGAKTISTILNEAAILAAIITTLADCAALDLSAGATTLALTVKARYNAAAAAGIRVHVRYPTR